MFVTRVLNAIKSKYVLVRLESTVSGHKFCRVRERKEDKMEVIWFDPWVRQSVIYKEIEKVKGIGNIKDYRTPTNHEVTPIKSWKIDSMPPLPPLKEPPA